MPRMSTIQFFVAGRRATLLVLCALGLWSFSSCSRSPMSQANSDANAAGNQPMATVNGKIIPLKLYEMYLPIRPFRAFVPGFRSTVRLN